MTIVIDESADIPTTVVVEKPKPNPKKKKKKLTDNQFRVVVAKDVIAQIKAKKYLARPGTFISPTYLSPTLGETSNEHFARRICTSKYCGVCAVGAVVASIVHLKSDGIVNPVFENGIQSKVNPAHQGFIGNIVDTMATMRRVWGINDADLMELAFENGDGVVKVKNADLNDYDVMAALLFGRQYDNANDRLIAIMRNIIANKGRFRPERHKIKGLSIKHMVNLMAIHSLDNWRQHYFAWTLK